MQGSLFAMASELANSFAKGCSCQTEKLRRATAEARTATVTVSARFVTSKMPCFIFVETQQRDLRVDAAPKSNLPIPSRLTVCLEVLRNLSCMCVRGIRREGGGNPAIVRAFKVLFEWRSCVRSYCARNHSHSEARDTGFVEGGVETHGKLLSCVYRRDTCHCIIASATIWPKIELLT